MKAVLISIKPKWCDLIRRGRKTVEVRKTCPKLEVPFKVYIYETMDGGRGSGLVFGEFVCIGFDVFRPIGKGISIKRFPALYESCLTLDEIVKYAQGEPVYGWHISELKIYDQPKDIMCFHCAVEENELWCKKCAIGKKKDVHCAFCYGLDGLRLRRPPQSWRYVEERRDSE